MKSTELILRPQLRKSEIKAFKASVNAELLKEVLRNPAFQIILSYVVIEYLQKENVIPQVAGTMAEGAILTAVTMQQLAPLAPYIAQSAEGLFKAIGSVGGMVLAAKGGG